MKIGYFTATDIAISETFIYNLIIGLESKCEENQNKLIHITGNKKGKPVAKNTIFAHFRLNNRLIKAIDEIEERFKLNTNLAIRIKHYWVNRRLGKLRKEDTPDVAYVDYGQASVLLYKHFTKKNIPFVIHFHGFDANRAFNSLSYSKEMRHVFKKATFIVVASHFLKRLLILKGCPPEKINIVRYGIDVENMKPLPWSEKLIKNPSVAFLGRLTEKKNPIALLHAFHIVKKQIPSARLTIIGDGKLKNDVLEHIDLLNIRDSVTLLGSLPQEKAYEELRKHWIYAQHSVTAHTGDQEGCAISPGEAAAFELPVISTIHNGIPEYVVDGKSGFLVREFDYVTMGEKIIELLNNTKKAQEMGKEGRSIVSKLNDPKKRIESIYKLLKTAELQKVHFN